MLSDFAGLLNCPQYHTLLGIQQSVMLGELAVNRMLDNLVPQSFRCAVDTGFVDQKIASFGSSMRLCSTAIWRRTQRKGDVFIYRSLRLNQGLSDQ
ncbi:MULTISPECIES: hypothetical protein [Pseudomonas]|uniref:Uncharacterized protein n=1 Tax=Pseudomonas wuhanensis TaxID=2954098 RepID=A0ABY9H0M8_9PSED|nr:MULTISPECIES: hypothetical protein [unclassified Pseudomonas]WLI15696.1 hypothetical protein PSH65_07785 [Pseudomonas sp. FP603]WLI21485.1 hypothetical protein PSH88_07795 [Pseudomonas sp. FP607]